MKLFVVASVLACASAAPSGILHSALSYGAPAVHHATTVQEHIAPAGPAIARTHVQHGIVGSRTVQVGTQAVQVGHKYNVVGQTVHPRPDETYVAEPAKAYSHTVPLPEPALPVAPAVAAYALPKALTNQGPAPIDTVTQERIIAPGRVHQVITPQVTRIEPELQVNHVPYEVLKNVPVPVEREVIVQKKVAKPFTVEVEQPYHVPVPVPVDTVRDQYVTPVIQKHTASVSHPVVATHGYAAAPLVAAHGYAAHGYAAAPAVTAIKA